jgi:hypothetical protein
MNNKKYYYIQFLGNCTEDPDIRLYVLGGLTENQLENWRGEFEKIQTAYEKEHEGDFSEYDVKDAIESAAEKLGIGFEYPKVEYTIYI